MSAYVAGLSDMSDSFFDPILRTRRSGRARIFPPELDLGNEAAKQFSQTGRLCRLEFFMQRCQSLRNLGRIHLSQGRFHGSLDFVQFPLRPIPIESPRVDHRGEFRSDVGRGRQQPLRSPVDFLVQSPNPLLQFLLLLRRNFRLIFQLLFHLGLQQLDMPTCENRIAEQFDEKLNQSPTEIAPPNRRSDS